MIELRQYQETAIEELKTKVNEMLNYTGNKVCVFKSPTGSGKTIMTAEFLKRLVLHSEKDLAFIWISVNQLHDQSRIKLESYYEGTRIIKCSEFDDLKLHLEKQFRDGMCWDNYGSFWHIDHKIPISFAKSKREVLELYALDNLQPLEASVNCSKANHFVSDLFGIKVN